MEKRRTRLWRPRLGRHKTQTTPSIGLRSEALEPRVLFSADLPWVNLDASPTDPFEQSYQQSLFAAASPTQTTALLTQGERQNLVVLDSSLLEAEQTSAIALSAHFEASGYDVAVLESNGNGISQLGALLDSETKVGTIELMTTADVQGVWLGDSLLDINNVLNHITEISSWSDQFDVRSQFQIYASGLESYADGEHLTELLSRLTGTDVSLSNYTSPDDVALPVQDTRREIVFVDTAVEGYEALVADIKTTQTTDRALDIFLLDPERDGVEQINETLQSYQDLDAIHLISHGSDGVVQLGGSTLSSDSLNGYLTGLTSWRDALSEQADLLIYGCDLAASEGGETLIGLLADLTGADVAASDDLTGAQLLGGDWELEFADGDIEAQIAFSESLQNDWMHVLATTQETLVNETTTSAQESNAFGGGSIAADADGNFVVVWQDNSSGSYDVYARLFNADGTPRSNEFLVNSTTVSDQRSASVAMDVDGDFVVTWTSYNQDQTGTQGVYAQRFDASGVAQGSEFRVNTAVSGDQWRAKVGMDDVGNFVISFTDQNATSGDVYLQRYSAAGTALGANIRVNTTTDNEQSYSDIAVHGSSGNIAVVWDSLGQDGDQSGVFVQLYDSGGNPISGETPVNINTLGFQENAKVAFAADGGFVVAWDNEFDFAVRTFDASGVAISGEIVVNTTTSGYQGFGDIGVDADGQFVAAWSNDNGGGSYSIDAQRFAADGSKIGPELTINESTTGSRSDVSVDFVGGTAVFSWTGEGGGDANGVFARAITFNDLIVSGTLDGGLRLNQNGSNNTYLLADDGGALLGGLGALSLEVDASINSSSFPYLFDYAVSGTSNEFSALVNGGGQIRVLIGGTGYTFASTVDPIQFDDGVRRTVGLTWDGATGELSLYADGKWQQTITGARAGYSLAAGGALVLGNDQDSVGGDFATNQAVSGELYRVRVFDESRSTAEMASSYRSDLPHDEAGMVAQWRFDTLSSGGVITDSVTGNNLTVRQVNQTGFTSSDHTLALQVAENALNGTTVGSVLGVDVNRETRIAQLLEADPELSYNAETDKFYKVDTGWHTPDEARTNAEAMTLSGVNGQLVTIRSANENAYISELVNGLGASVWIGGTDANVEGEWRWIDGGSEGDQFWSGLEDGYALDGVYQNWVSASQPNQAGGEEDWARLDTATGLWWDDKVGTVHRFVAEWDADDVLDATDPLTYSISSQTATGAFTIDADKGTIAVADSSLLDFETNSTHTLTVRVTNSAGDIYEENFSVSLTDLDESDGAPSDLSSGIELNTDGGNDAYLIANDGGGLLGGLDSFTVEITFASDNVGVANSLISYAAGGTAGNDLALILQADGHLELMINGGGRSLEGLDYSALLLDGNQHNVAVSWDSTNGDWQVYVDSELVDSGTGYRSGELLNGSAGTGVLLFGQDQDSIGGGFQAGEVFSGTIYDVRVWNEVRSEAEIALNDQNKFDSSNLPGGLIANWQMAGFNGSSEIVDVVSGNNLGIGHASGAGFTASTPVEDLHISENANSGTSVGFVVPSDPEVKNDIIQDGLFLESSPASGGIANFAAGASLGSWTVGDATGVTVFNGDYAQTPPSGGHIVTLDNPFASISQTLVTEVGKQYQIIFDHAGGFGDGLVNHVTTRVSVAGLSQDFSLEKPVGWSFNTHLGWETRSMTFTASDVSTELIFQTTNQTPQDSGLIAGVRVIEIPAAVTAILNDDATLSYDAATDKFYRVTGLTENFDVALGIAANSQINGVAGQLISIRSQYENELIRDMATVSLNWLSASDATVEGEWRWLDGNIDDEQFSTGATPEDGYFVNWEAGRPYTSTVSNFGFVDVRDGEWGDTVNGSTLGVIVEWDASEVLSSFTFSLTDDADGRFAIKADSGEITVADGSLLDYETATSHNVTVEVVDASGNSYSEVIAIAIDNLGGEPTQSLPSSQSLDIDTPLVFSDANNNAITVSDTDSATDARLQVFISTNFNGTLTLSQTTGLSILGGSNGSTFMTIHGNESDLNAAFEGMTFTPVSGYTGPVTLNMTTSLGAELVGRYTFDAGNAIDDSVGISQNGTFNGNASTVFDGTRGEVLNLGGDGDFVSIADDFGRPTNYTLAAWVNLSNADTQGAEVITLGTSTALRLDASNGPVGFYWDGANWQFTDSTAGTGSNLAGTGWRHVSYSVDSTNNVQRLYIDGVLVGETNHVGDHAMGIGESSRIGAHGANSPGDFDFNGMIDDARIYTRALSGEEILVLASDADSVSDSMVITVDPANSIPVAVADAVSTNEDTPVIISPIANDTDANADGIAIVEFTQATNGSVIDNGDGTFTYTPDSNYTGPDAFDYVAIDAGAGLQHYFGLDGNAVDSIGAADGIVTGTTTEAGHVGNGIRFNETGSDYVTLPDITYSSEFTISFEFKVDEINGSLFQYLYSHGDINSANSINVFINEDAHGSDPSVLRTVVRDGNDTLSNTALEIDISSAGLDLVDGQFHTYTLKAGRNGLEVFIDGVAVASDASRGTGGVNPTGDLFLGRREVSPEDRYFGGVLDSVQIYDNALSSDEIMDIASGVNRGTVNITIDSINEAPTVNLLNGSPSFTEGSAGVVLDGDVDVSDIELDALNGGLGNYAGASLTLVRASGASSEDVFSFNDGNGITHLGGNLFKNGQVVASFDSTTTPGQLVISFTDANGESPTSVDVDNILRQLTYSNSSDAPPANAQINWTFSDGNTGFQGSGGALQALGSTTVDLIDVPNGATLVVPIAQSVDEDTLLTLSGSNAIVIDTGSSYNPVVSVTLSVSNGSLTVATTTGVTFAGGTNNGDATITIYGSESDINAALDGLQYQSNADYNGSDALTVTTGSSAVVDANLYARYEFLGGGITDQSGNGYDGTISGDPTLTNDPERGDVMTFDSNDRIDVVGGVGSLGSQVTLSAWVNLDAGQQEATFLSIGDEFWVTLDRTNSSYSMSVHARGFTTNSLSSVNNIAGEGWNHVAATLNDATNELQLYLNGVLIRSSTWDFGDIDWATANSSDITLGSKADGSNSFVGSLDDVRVYNSELTEQEIVAVMGDNGFEFQTVAITVDAVNDSPVGTVDIDNLNPSQGDTLTVSNTITDADGISGSISYQWYRDGVAITGETGTTYTTAQTDVDSVITAVASYTDDQGTTESVTSAATAAVTNINDSVSGQPVILGTPIEDQILTLDTSGISDADGLGTFSYQWFRDGVAIGSATSDSLTLSDADVGTNITIAVSYTDGQGTAESTTSAVIGPIANVNDVPSGTVDIDNLNPSQGDTLTVSNTITDADGISGPISYQWYRDGVAITGETGTTYTMAQTDVDSVITAVASYTDDQGTTESVTSAATATVTNINDSVSGQPVILGMPTEDQILTLDISSISDADELGTFSYQWFRDGVAIGGATSDSLTLSDADVGANISVAVSYTDGQGTAESTTSTPVGPIANLNDAPSGSVSIDNLAPSQGDTLSVSNTLTDSDGLSGSIAYQWYRDGVAVAGETATTYTTTQADVDSVITAVASYTDDQGTTESVTSAATAAVTNVNDAVVGVPVILGTPTEDQTLTLDTSGISDADGLGTFSYQWFRDGVAISGANTDSLVLGDTDVGANISVAVSYTDGQGTAESTTSAATAAVTNINDLVSGQPVILGMPTEDQILTLDTSGISDADGLDAFSYQWFRDGVAIGSATSDSLTLSDADVGTNITIAVSYADGQGTAESTTSAVIGPIANVNDVPSGTVDIDNLNPSQGDTLTVSNTITDADGISGPISYQWYRDGVAITGETGTTYTMAQTDVDSVITAVASYTDDQGTTESVTSAATATVTNINDSVSGQPVILGTPIEDQILTLDTSGISDADGLGTFSYQWFRDGVAISGANTDSLVLGDTDVGANISVAVSYTDGQGTAESTTSTTVGPVANINDAPVGSVLIDNGSPSQGDTLAVSNTITDADGISGPISYQWYRDGVAVAGETATTYTTTQADVDSVITAVASYTDDEGTTESTTSAATAAVTNVNDSASGQPVILGMPTEDQILTLDISSISDADGLGTFSYQWFRDGVAIGGATSDSLTLSDADVGANISVAVSYTDGQGTAESTTSAAVGPIANINDAPVGSVLIDNGSPSQGDTLTVSNTITDADGISGSISYLWYRDGVAITGETGTTYTTAQTDVDSVITAVASYTDDEGTTESVTSAGTAAVTNVNDAVVGVPVILGTPTEDQTLTLDTSGISDADGLGTFSYQWFRDGVAISGANTDSFVLGDTDVGANISVAVSYTDGQGTAESTTSTPVGPIANVNDVPVGTVDIDNLNPSQGDTLTVSNTITDADGISGSISYQWLRDGVAVAGETATTYTASQADVGAVIAVMASYTDDQGATESVTSALTAAVININDAPQIDVGLVFSVAESAGDGEVVGQVTANDTDSGSVLSSWTIVSGNAGGVFEIDSDSGEIRVVDRSQLDFETTSSYALGITVSDGAAVSASVEVSINVTDFDEAPAPSDDLLTTMEDTSLVIDSMSLLANDTDPESQTLTIVGMSQPANGLMMDQLDGTWRYQPNPNFNGVERISYIVSDGANQRTAELLIVVESVNDAPVMQTPDLIEMSENQNIVTSLASLDVDGDLPTYALTGGMDADAFDIDSASGTLRFTNAPDFENAVDANQDNVFEVQVTADDGNGGQTALTLQIEIANVNEAPSIAATRFSAPASENQIWIGQLNALDPDSDDPLTFEIVSSDIENLFRIDPQTGEIVRATQSAEPGVYQLEVQVTDGAGLTSNAMIELVITEPSVFFVPVPNTDGGPAEDSIDSPVTESSEEEGSDSETQIQGEADGVEAEHVQDNGHVDEPAEETTSSISENGVNNLLPISHLLDGTSIDDSFESFDPLNFDIGSGFSTAGDRTDNVRPGNGASGSADVSVRFVFGQTDIPSYNGNADLTQQLTTLMLPVSSEFQKALENLANDATSNNTEIDLRVSGAVAGSISLSAGFVAWMLRGGSLMASLLTAKPMWTEFDPLPVFSEDDSDLEPDHSFSAPQK